MRNLITLILNNKNSLASEMINDSLYEKSYKKLEDLKSEVAKTIFKK